MAFDVRCYRCLKGITWIHRITNEAVKQKTIYLIADYGPLPEVARRMNLQWPVVILPSARVRLHNGLVKGARGRERPNRRWLTDLQSGLGLGLQDV